MQFRSVRSSHLRTAGWATITCLFIGSTLACSNEPAAGEAQSNTAGEDGEGGQGGSGGVDDRNQMGGSTEPPATFDALMMPSSPDAGGTDVKTATSGDLVPAIMGAGYGGIRTVSFDDGLTWKTLAIANPRNADDENLIRAVGYVGGVWIAVGWKVYRSVDGKQWTAADLPGGWYDCVSESNGKIIVKTIRSDYGGQNGDTLSSSYQGKTWQEVRANKPVCNYAPSPFPTNTGLLRGRGAIERSTDQGKTWRRVFEDCCWVETFATGSAAR